VGEECGGRCVGDSSDSWKYARGDRRSGLATPLLTLYHF
jgi:hypothetical protein